MSRANAGLIVGILVVIICRNACGWGPSAHTYVAKQIVGVTWLDALYASMLPDMFGFGGTPEMESRVQRLTHDEFDRLAPSSFAFGFATHNGYWGADFYSHSYWNPSIPDTYLTSRMKQFASEFGRSVNDGETVLEAVVDYLIRKDLGAEWGGLVASTANAVGGSQEQAIVDAFAKPLSERVSGLSVDAAGNALRNMFQQHRILTRVYGQQLELNDIDFIRATLVSGFAAYFHVEDAVAETYMARAEELCWDYRDELDAIAQKVAVELNETPYAMPVGPHFVVLCKGVLVFVFLSFRRRWN